MNNQLKDLPTDNLYKFIALSGVTVALASAWLFVSKAYEAKDFLGEIKDELLFISNITQWGFSIGIVMAITGFILWYYRIQKPMDRELAAKSELTATQVRLNNAKLDLRIFEDIYKELSLIQDNINQCNLLMLGELGFGLKFDPAKLPKTNLRGVKMKVTFYLPELLPELEKIENIYKNFYSVITNFILKNKPAEQIKEDFIVEGTTFSKSANHAINELKDSLSKIANEKAKEFNLSDKS